MIRKGWPFELLDTGIEPDGPPDDGGRPGVPH
jgi:hypothetical protein